jgi:hypothetical protein
MNVLWDNIIIILALTAVMSFQLLIVMYSRTYQLTENARAVELVARCKLWDIFQPSQPSRTLELACPRVHGVRL